MQIKGFNSTMAKQDTDSPMLGEDSGYYSEKSDTPGSSEHATSSKISSHYRQRLASTPCTRGEPVPLRLDPSNDFTIIAQPKSLTKICEQSLLDSTDSQSPQWLRSCISGRIMKRPSAQTRSPNSINETPIFDEKVKPRTFARKSPPRVKLTLLQKLLEGPLLILRHVLTFLPPEDLKRISQVNKAFRSFIHRDVILMKRKRHLLDMTLKHVVQVGKENVSNKKSATEAVSYPVLSPRKHLENIENLQKTPTKGKSPHKVYLSLSDRFIKEGQKLDKDGRLQSCVKCKHPARWYKDKSQAVCTRAECGFNYCTNCFLKYHEKASDCIMNKSRPKTLSGRGINLAKCRRNLRRL